MIAFASNILRAVAGTAAAMVPRRWWPLLDDYVPASDAAFAASLLTLLAGAAVGIPAFLAHAGASASLNNDAYVATAMHIPGDEAALPSGLSVLSLFTFVLFTPAGWASSYLVFSGFVRTVGSRFDDPHGDFLLTAADATVRATLRRTGLAHQDRKRRRLEGPAVPDRTVRGVQVGMPSVELVIVASQIKDGWVRGGVVLSDEGAFRIVGVEDKLIGGRLRHLYALARHTDLEVFRQTVQYEFASEARQTTDASLTGGQRSSPSGIRRR